MFHAAARAAVPECHVIAVKVMWPFSRGVVFEFRKSSLWSFFNVCYRFKGGARHQEEDIFIDFCRYSSSIVEFVSISDLSTATQIWIFEVCHSTTRFVADNCTWERWVCTSSMLPNNYKRCFGVLFTCLNLCFLFFYSHMCTQHTSWNDVTLTTWTRVLCSVSAHSL